MQIKGLERLKTLTDKLKIFYVWELVEVYKANKKDGEAVITTLERMLKEKETN